MTAPDTDPQLVSEAARLKKLTVAHNARFNWHVGAAFIAGVVVGVGAWFLQRPMDRDFGLDFGLGCTTSVFVILFCSFVFPRPSANCPQCGCAWGEEGRNDWLTWKCCPGCGLKMCDDTGGHEQI